MNQIALPSTIDVTSVEDLPSLAGRDLILTDWIVVPQEMIDAFAQATGDEQWIHVDPKRASAGPFGTTVAHGFLTLALLPRFLASVRLGDVSACINSDVHYARFLSPVRSGMQLRARLRLVDIGKKPNGIRATWNIVIEGERSPVPVCVAEWKVVYVLP